MVFEDYYDDSVQVGDRRQWILSILYAPDQSGNSRPIYGMTRFMKSCFLVDRKLEENLGISTDFNFGPGKYGPLDEGVYAALDQLIDEDLVKHEEEDEHSGRYNGVRFSLTEDGMDSGANHWEGLTSDERSLLRWVKYKHTLKKLGTLLSFVYNQYPDMTEESVIDEKELKA